MPLIFTWKAHEFRNRMKSKAFIRAVCLAGFLVAASRGFSSGSSSLQRTFASSVTLTNWPVVVTATFTNGEGTVLDGLFYSDQVPSALLVTTLSLTLNGIAVTNYTFESGQDGDVYSGYTPCRWILESPTNFPETNPVPSQATVQIVYAVNSLTPGSFAFQQFTWVAYEPGLTNAIFGYSGSADQQVLQFVTTSYRPFWRDNTQRTASPSKSPACRDTITPWRGPPTWPVGLRSRPMGRRLCLQIRMQWDFPSVFTVRVGCHRRRTCGFGGEAGGARWQQSLYKFAPGGVYWMVVSCHGFCAG